MSAEIVVFVSRRELEFERQLRTLPAAAVLDYSLRLLEAVQRADKEREGKEQTNDGTRAARPIKP